MSTSPLRLSVQHLVQQVSRPMRPNRDRIGADTEDHRHFTMTEFLPIQQSKEFLVFVSKSRHGRRETVFCVIFGSSGGRQDAEATSKSALTTLSAALVRQTMVSDGIQPGHSARLRRSLAEPSPHHKEDVAQKDGGVCGR